MTENLMRLVGLGIVSAIFATILKKSAAELSILLSLAACVLIAVLFAGFLKPVLQLIEKLRVLSGLDAELYAPVLKCVGIAFLSQISSNICVDAGQNSIGKMIELCGASLALYVSLPLFDAVLELIQSIGAEG